MLLCQPSLFGLTSTLAADSAGRFPSRHVGRGFGRQQRRRRGVSPRSVSAPLHLLKPLLKPLLLLLLLLLLKPLLLLLKPLLLHLLLLLLLLLLLFPLKDSAPHPSLPLPLC